MGGEKPRTEENLLFPSKPNLIVQFGFKIFNVYSFHKDNNIHTGSGVVVRMKRTISEGYQLKWKESESVYPCSTG